MFRKKTLPRDTEIVCTRSTSRHCQLLASCARFDCAQAPGGGHHAGYVHVLVNTNVQGEWGDPAVGNLSTPVRNAQGFRSRQPAASTVPALSKGEQPLGDATEGRMHAHLDASSESRKVTTCYTMCGYRRPWWRRNMHKKL